ncbi:MAG: DUF4123 domain-containing protein [Betaproteobacteria bacterium]|nr:DUF4123 domain-containing protein [Betaproteobacteria bacterium]
MDYAGFLRTHQFALVDQAHLKPQEWHEGLPLLPLESYALKANPDLLPALLPLEPGAPYMDALIENLELAEDDPGLLTPCALLTVALGTEPEQLQRHLGKCLVVNLEVGRTAYVRYFDPTVFPWLARIIPPNRLSLLYGPILSWTIPFQKEWVSFPAPQTEHKAAAWVMTAEQWERVELIRLVDRVLTECEKVMGCPWESFEEYDHAAITAERAMMTAQTLYGIERLVDLQAFAVDSVFHGEHFHRHPFIQNLLRHLPPEGYKAASFEINQATWAEAKALTHSH